MASQKELGDTVGDLKMGNVKKCKIKSKSKVKNGINRDFRENQ